MSSAALGIEVDYDRVLDRHFVGDVGVPHSPDLLSFTNAVQIGEPDLAAARARLSQSVGDEALLEAAATIAVFNGLVRVADGTGIQLDGGVFAVSAHDRARLGIDRFAGAANTSNTTTSSASDIRATLPIGQLFGNATTTRN